jgi:hypothetical protein
MATSGFTTSREYGSEDGHTGIHMGDDDDAMQHRRPAPPLGAATAIKLLGAVIAVLVVYIVWSSTRPALVVAGGVHTPVASSAIVDVVPGPSGWVGSLLHGWSPQPSPAPPPSRVQYTPGESGTTKILMGVSGLTGAAGISAMCEGTDGALWRVPVGESGAEGDYLELRLAATDDTGGHALMVTLRVDVAARPYVMCIVSCPVK